MIGLSSLRAEYIRDNTSEVVLDTTTNLIWQDNNKTIGDANKKTWSDAINYCESLEHGGSSEWRLPNFNELYMLADRSIYKPAISPVFQNVVSSYYWSSTTSASYASDAWVVSFNYGGDNAGDKTGTNFVRCVR